MYRAFIVNATYLGLYDTLKHKIISTNMVEDGITCQFLTASITGVAASTMASPIDNVKINLQTNPEYSGSSIPGCAKKLWRQAGWRAFYRGYLG